MNIVNNPCDQLFSYFVNDLDDHERNEFELHLSACSSCQEELAELSKTWEMLPMELDEVEPPPHWKAEILGEITGSHPEANMEESAEGKNIWVHTSRPGKARRAASIAAACLLIIGAASWWGINQMQRLEQAAERTELMPSQFVAQYDLKSFDQAHPEAKGKAWIAQKGATTQLVLQTSGLPALEGEQAYQVWLVKKGERSNCGTFRVDLQGNGIMTYTLKEAGKDFDTIGITLEPDPGGTQPRGKKMLGI
ncbi:anti-sigma factor [Paenibacillus thalictri]|uniref:Regulator of SigK n=1 Tax=Paenibacillus thalictri TaxID=2527873 RepID=A0A4Q9DSZ6_9BACL|nr:anti-sigma factor [Paenibacillus thalictri]TBL78214.1 hypothetical protein EYB31_15180 [Paenibacillus thalictri]